MSCSQNTDSINSILWSGLFNENVLPGDLVLHKCSVNEHGTTAQSTGWNYLSRSTTQAASRPENSIQSALIPGYFATYWAALLPNIANTLFKLWCDSPDSFGTLVLNTILAATVSTEDPVPCDGPRSRTVLLTQIFTANQLWPLLPNSYPHKPGAISATTVLTQQIFRKMFSLTNASNHSEVKQTYVHMQEFPGFILQKARHVFMLARRH